MREPGQEPVEEADAPEEEYDQEHRHPPDPTRYAFPSVVDFVLCLYQWMFGFFFKASELVRRRVDGLLFDGSMGIRSVAHVFLLCKGFLDLSSDELIPSLSRTNKYTTKYPLCQGNNIGINTKN